MTELSPLPAASCPVRPLTADIDASTRFPVFMMASASVKWLLLSLIAGLISSMKLHMPGLLSSWPIFTYGRLVALQDSVFIYGFASQAAMAVALWLICRLGGTRLIGRGATNVATLFWNLGVWAGVIGILKGDGAPWEHFQFPQYTMSVLLLAYLVYGVAAVLTFSNRSECSMYPSLWFILAGLVFFPWVYASAMMTLWSPLVRPAVKPIIAAWAANNITMLWLGAIALGAIFYFLPKASGRKLYSYGLAVFSFWLFVLFGQSTNMHFLAAIPAWVQGMSEICALLFLLPAAAMMINWYHSAVWDKELCVELCFSRRGAVFFIMSAIFAAIGAIPAVRGLVQFTIFQTGLNALFLLGFVATTFLAAFTYILPRVTGMEWPRANRVSLHRTLTFWGAMLVAIPLILGGFIQGAKAGDATVDFLKAVRVTFPFVGIAIIGYLFMIAGQVFFLLNINTVFWTSCRECCNWSNKEVARK
jgi:cytochrome c oxidase cbb3-type subunit 1